MGAGRGRGREARGFAEGGLGKESGRRIRTGRRGVGGGGAHGGRRGLEGPANTLGLDGNEVYSNDLDGIGKGVVTIGGWNSCLRSMRCKGFWRRRRR